MTVVLPDALVSAYRPATSREIRSWSFGVVKASRSCNAADWPDQRGTLDDQAVFGPTTSDKCACGKYDGPGHRRMICDRCGVKVTSTGVRRERFGHIELGPEFRHPFGEDGDTLAAFPVLPATFRES